MQVKLELKDVSVNADRDTKNERDMHLTRVGWEHSELIVQFPDAICPAGDTQLPFTFQVPANLPQSMYVAERFNGTRFKLKYFFKAQLVPVNPDLLNNDWGKCKLRDR